LSEESLDPQQKAALQEHLEECDSCRLLSSAWQEVEARLQIAPMEEPQPGFTSRWQARLLLERKRLERRQSMAFLTFNIGGAVILLASLLIWLWPALRSPGEFLVVWSYRISSWLTLANVADGVVSALLRTITGLIPPVWWVLFAGLLCLLVVLWVVSYQLLLNPRRVSQ
jgi:anti-sigma factor RsiW